MAQHTYGSLTGLILYYQTVKSFFVTEVQAMFAEPVLRHALWPRVPVRRTSSFGREDKIIFMQIMTIFPQIR